MGPSLEAVREIDQTVRDAEPKVTNPNIAIADPSLEAARGNDQTVRDAESKVTIEGDRAMWEMYQTVSEIERALRKASRAVRDAERALRAAEQHVRERRKQKMMMELAESRSEEDQAVERARDPSTDATIDAPRSDYDEAEQEASSGGLSFVNTFTDDFKPNGDEAEQGLNGVTNTKQKKPKLPPLQTGEKKSSSELSPLEPDSEVENDRWKAMIASGMSRLEPGREGSMGDLARLWS